MSSLFPYLLLEGATIIVIISLVQLNQIVHGTLYNYGLNYSSDWAVPYWIASSIMLSLLFFTLVALPIIGYVSYKKQRKKNC